MAERALTISSGYNAGAMPEHLFTNTWGQPPRSIKVRKGSQPLTTQVDDFDESAGSELPCSSEE